MYCSHLSRVEKRVNVFFYTNALKLAQTEKLTALIRKEGRSQKEVSRTDPSLLSFKHGSSCEIKRLLLNISISYFIMTIFIRVFYAPKLFLRGLSKHLLVE